MGQQKPIKLLTTLLRNGTIPHALLLSGIDGIGKQLTAMTFAMACNCLDLETGYLCEDENSLHTAQNRYAGTNPCGSCKSCRKVQSGNHPDIIIVEPSGPYIKIGQIRALCHTLAMKPLEARLRVVLISDSQAMNSAAGNALLKVLEEPPDRTILMLTARHPSDLFPTILSRCHHIRFNPISRESIVTILIEKEGVHPDDAEIISTMANGSLSKALSMIGLPKKTNWIHQRNWLINEIDSLSLKPVGSLLAFAARLSKNKAMLPEFLEMIQSYLRDLVVCKYCPEKIINRDLQSKIQNRSQKMTTASLLSQISMVQSAQKDMRTNANLRLTLEVLVMRLAAV
ncbi:MAG: DNA polymerase III subunit delta' [Desulfobacterales bacterium]|uniref:DNA polymerase III subunit delta' n=1 Tax=Candidatus Desulfatibia vada TaxID=2841696 RepID=A0A8J6P0X7_9BACT|nr:DNA polymerase III subunit delta' [Candidatus Desulfatibia vada]MBL6972269.1 DNA polymerase III subunit delta' [Desulfobacterales bacterium]